MAIGVRRCAVVSPRFQLLHAAGEPRKGQRHGCLGSPARPLCRIQMNGGLTHGLFLPRILASSLPPIAFRFSLRSNSWFSPALFWRVQLHHQFRFRSSLERHSQKACPLCLPQYSFLPKARRPERVWHCHEAKRRLEATRANPGRLNSSALRSASDNPGSPPHLCRREHSQTTARSSALSPQAGPRPST
jgi:hypothetical protein